MGSAQDIQSWTTQLRKGLAEFAVLAILKRGESYGYQVVEGLRDLAGLDLSESTVYPLLARLAKDGLLAMRTAPSELGPPRRYYRLNAAGAQRLRLMAGLWRETNDAMSQLLQGDLS